MKFAANAGLSLFGALLLTAAASACPFCDGGPSGVNEVKAVVFGEDFWPNLLGTAAPFGVFLAVAALVHFGLPFPRTAAPKGGGK